MGLDISSLMQIQQILFLDTTKFSQQLTEKSRNFKHPPPTIGLYGGGARLHWVMCFHPGRRVKSIYDKDCGC